MSSLSNVNRFLGYVRYSLLTLVLLGAFLAVSPALYAQTKSETEAFLKEMEKLGIPAKPTNYITDAANVLNASEISALNAKLKAYEDSTTTQIFVLTIPTTGDREISDLGTRIQEQWKAGTAGKDNGLLMILAINDRKVRFETGYGLEGALTDAMSINIISNVMAPQLKKQAYGAAIEDGTGAVIAVLAGEYKADPAKSTGKSGKGFPRWLIIVGVILLIFLGGRGGGRGRGYSYGGRGLRSMPPVFFGGGGFGGGGFGGGGGGFGGFGDGGGGSSGGGGATGGW